jgi:hypothetical protein
MRGAGCPASCQMSIAATQSRDPVLHPSGERRERVSNGFPTAARLVSQALGQTFFESAGHPISWGPLGHVPGFGFQVPSAFGNRPITWALRVFYHPHEDKGMLKRWEETPTRSSSRPAARVDWALE